MNRNYNILYGALLLLVAGACFQSCRQDEWEDIRTDRETLIAEGRYLTAREGDASVAASDTEDPKQFPVGTPYRLLAYARAYDATDAFNETKNAPGIPRFNKVAWEGEVTGGPRFIHIDSEPVKWFGFSALDGEPQTGTDQLVSLDFYGFTYGKAVPEADRTGYIPVDGWKDGASKHETKLEELTHTSSVSHQTNGVYDGELEDLMRGVLLNQNIKTAGKSPVEGTTVWTDNAYTQSVMPFRHCYSKLNFQVSQQVDEENKDAQGNPTPCFPDLHVESIEVTNTYASGTVYLKDGLVEVTGEKINRPLKFKDGSPQKVMVNNTDVGNMIVFPSDGESLKNYTGGGDGYSVGLKIKVKSTVKKDIENMLKNTNGNAEGMTETTETKDDGTTVTWYSGTIVKNEIIDYYAAAGTTGTTGTTTSTKALYFKQNALYRLIITFQKDGVRIITVIPLVEEWLPGEGTPKDPWEDQALGHPQMFNNIVWSDRNLGASEDEPANGYERIVGYFYQPGRNIPYYPFNPGATDGSIKADGTPDYNSMNYQGLANANTKWGWQGQSESPYKFYPIVDSRILNMRPNGSWTMSGTEDVWEDTVKKSVKRKPQMKIPEKKPTDCYFNFMRSSDQNSNNGLKDDDNMHWEKGVLNQPVTGVWVIPSSSDFMSVFPSTPHAGNITMKRGGDNNQPTNWGDGDEANGVVYQTVHETLRVTVPYYTTDMAEPTGKSAKYLEAWNMLKANDDPGTTHVEEYVRGAPNVNEPDGDPSDGYASVYVISRKEGHKYSLLDYVEDKYKSDFWIKEWGTIYAIKNIYTPKAYRMRWRALIAAAQRNADGTPVKTRNPCIYIEVCRYRCHDKDTLTETNYDSYDWDHPVAKMYFPIAGLGDFTGQYINFGTECQYATSDPIVNGKTSAVQIKISGNNGANAYMAIVKNVVCRTYAMQIRPILTHPGGGGR